MKTFKLECYRFVTEVALLLIAVLFPSTLFAAPWLEPSDARARFAVQKLSDRGHLDHSVSTWPVMWGNIDQGVEVDARRDFASLGSAARYLAFEGDQQASVGARAELTVSASNETAAFGGFEQRARIDTAASLTFQWQGDRFAFGFSPAAVHDPDDDREWRLDGSYIAATAANWVFGAGAIDRWWGPGWQSSLILSNNAHPMPSVWISRNNTYAPESDWFRWVGPWDVIMLAGQYEHARAIPEAKLLGMRFVFRPLQGLDIGLSRMIMFGGEGRPEGLDTLWNALIGRDNGQEGQANDPSNQLGAVDVRFGFGLGDQTLGLYAQMMGEDEAGAFPARKSWLWGADWTTQLIGSDQQWFLEYANTTADDFLGEAMPDITYEHSRYRTGYRYRGRFMGSSYGGDAEAVTLGVFNFFEGGSNANVKVTYVNLNQDGRNRVLVPGQDVFYGTAGPGQSLGVLDAGYGSRFLGGWLDLALQLTDKRIEYVSGEKERLSVGAAWTYRF